MGGAQRTLGAVIGVLLVAAVTTAIVRPNRPDAVAHRPRHPAQVLAETITKPQPKGLDWKRVGTDVFHSHEPAATLAALRAPDGPFGWVAVGYVIGADGRSSAEVWQSPNGTDWTATVLSAATDRDDFAAYDVARLGTDLVMVGEHRTGTGVTRRAAVWTMAVGAAPARVPEGEVFAGARQVRMYDVAAGPFGAVATGRVSAGPGVADDKVGVWHSTDGRSWQRLPEAEAVFEQSNRPSISNLAVSGSGIVAVGNHVDGTRSVVGAWYSDDGVHWAAAAPAPDFASGSETVHASDVTAVPAGGYLAAGYRYTNSRRSPVVWRSRDGHSWAAVGSRFDLIDMGSDDAGPAVYAVTANAAGFTAVGGQPIGQRFWQSGDGVAWHELAKPENVDRSLEYSLDLVAASNDAVVAGATDEGVPRLLLRRGSSWTEVTAASPAFPPPAAATRGAILAVGSGRITLLSPVLRQGRQMGAETQDATRYDSTDGLAWHAVPPGQAFLHQDVRAATAAADSLVVTGDQGNEVFRTHDQWARAWTAALDGPWQESYRSETTIEGSRPAVLDAVGARDKIVVATGEANVTADSTDFDGIVAVSGDGGRSWRHLPSVDGMTGPGRSPFPYAVCTGPAGFLIVGSERTGASSSAAAWVSPDAVNWRRAPASPALSGGPTDHLGMNTCASTPDGWVSAGFVSAPGGTDAAAWTSPDGLTWTRVASPSFGGKNSQGVSAMTAAGSRLYALGYDTSSSEYVIALWRSDDVGRTWAREQLPDELFRGRTAWDASHIAVVGNRLLIAGVVDGDVAVWTAPLP